MCIGKAWETHNCSWAMTLALIVSFLPPIFKGLMDVEVKGHGGVIRVVPAKQTLKTLTNRSLWTLR